MSQPTRKNRPQTSLRIITALEAVMEQRGLQGVSVNRIALQADVSRVLIYRYFGSLEALLAYYVKRGILFPHFSPRQLEQMRPIYQSDRPRVWYQSVLKTYRSIRASKVAREVLKAAMLSHGITTHATSKAVDEEMSRFVDQFPLVEGADTQAVSALVLGGLSYLTLMAQQDRPMLGLDLRGEADWTRIEAAVKLIYIAMSQAVKEAGPLPINRQVSKPALARWQ